MSEPTALPTCPNCYAIRMPGAPMCTQCWAPLDEPAAMPDVHAAAPAEPAQTAMPAMDSRFTWNAAQGSVATPGIPTQGGPGQPPSGAHPGWRSVVPPTPVVRPRDSKNVVRIVGAVVAALLLLGVGGGYFWYRSSTPNEKELIAERFKNGRPPGFFPAFPNLHSGSSGLPESPGDAQQFLATIDPAVRKANDDIFALQKTMADWGKGKVNDETVRTAISGFLVDLKPLDHLSAPQSLDRGASKLVEAATDYRMSLDSLLDWIDSRNAGARTTYNLFVGDANVHWDEALIALYRGSGISQPSLPHPQVKD